MIKQCRNCGRVKESEECDSCNGYIGDNGYVNPSSYIPKYKDFCENCINSGFECCSKCELMFISGEPKAIPRYFCGVADDGSSEADPVKHPSHYQTKSGLETIQVIEAFTEDLKGIEAVYTGNIIKYICRWKKKNGLQDLKKAQWYLEHLIEHVENSGEYVNGYKKYVPSFNDLFEDEKEEKESK